MQCPGVCHEYYYLQSKDVNWSTDFSILIPRREHPFVNALDAICFCTQFSQRVNSFCRILIGIWTSQEKKTRARDNWMNPIWLWLTRPMLPNNEFEIDGKQHASPSRKRMKIIVKKKCYWTICWRARSGNNLISMTKLQSEWPINNFRFFILFASWKSSSPHHIPIHWSGYIVEFTFGSNRFSASIVTNWISFDDTHNAHAQILFLRFSVHFYLAQTKRTFKSSMRLIQTYRRWIVSTQCT